MNEDLAEATLEERLSVVLARVTYKPGWSISISRGRTRRTPGLPATLVATITRLTVDPDSPDKQLSVTEVILIHDRNDQRLIHDLRHALIRSELREVDEWFRVDGARLSNHHHHGL